MLYFDLNYFCVLNIRTEVQKGNEGGIMLKM